MTSIIYEYKNRLFLWLRREIEIFLNPSTIQYIKAHPVKIFIELLFIIFCFIFLFVFINGML